MVKKMEVKKVVAVSVVTFGLGSVVGAGLHSFLTSTGDVNVEKLRETVVSRLDGQVNIGRVSKSQIESLYEIEFKSGGVGYVDSTGTFFLLAPMIDAKEKRVASRFVQAAGVVSGASVEAIPAKREEATFGGVAPAPTTNARVDVTQLRGGVTWKHGNGARRLIVFSDPHCSFCKQLDQVLRDPQQLPDTTVEIFPYPIRTLHPQAASAAAWVLCQPEGQRSKAWQSVIDGGSYGEATSACAQKVAAIEALGEAWAVQSTPTIFAENGSRMSGASGANALLQFLDANKR